MRHSAKLALPLLLLTQTWTAAAQPEPLGRLFFTPEQRAVLDRQRQANLLPGGNGPDEGGAYTINGIVRRSGGRQTIWVNGTPLGDNEGPAFGKHNNFKVGETVLPGRDEKHDLLQGGRIDIQRAPGSAQDRQ